eukprot:m.38664 g.38664  ORF g.38664 m.38664 type:complete len:50 (-) comp17981_c1_seq1:22-171(-)
MHMSACDVRVWCFLTHGLEARRLNVVSYLFSTLFISSYLNILQQNPKKN